MAGDAIALSGLVVGGLVLIRSHTAFLALGEGTLFQQSLPVVGFVGALLIWWIGPPLLWRAAGSSQAGPLGLLHTFLSDPEAASAAAPGEAPRWIRLTAVALVLLSTAGLLALALMALLVGSTVVVHLHYAPPQIFWWGR